MKNVRRTHALNTIGGVRYDEMSAISNATLQFSYSCLPLYFFFFGYPKNSRRNVLDLHTFSVRPSFFFHITWLHRFITFMLINSTRFFFCVCGYYQILLIFTHLFWVICVLFLCCSFLLILHCRFESILILCDGNTSSAPHIERCLYVTSNSRYGC